MITVPAPHWLMAKTPRRTYCPEAIVLAGVEQGERAPTPSYTGRQFPAGALGGGGTSTSSTAPFPCLTRRYVGLTAAFRRKTSLTPFLSGRSWARETAESNS